MATNTTRENGNGALEVLPARSSAALPERAMDDPHEGALLTETAHEVAAPLSASQRRNRATTPLVGRERELSDLRDALASAESGAGRLVLLFGEPGVGKTRLATELLSEARELGWTTLAGRCPEGEVAPAFWPWVQVLRGLVQQLGNQETLHRALSPYAPDLAHLVPGLVEPVDDSQRPLLEPGSARFRFFDAVCGFLRAAAAERPTLVVIDDLHGADVDSLRLLSFFVRDLADAPVLVIGTYRDVEVHRDHPLSGTLAELVREPTVTSIPLTGFSEDEVASFVERLTGRPPGAEITTQLYRRTEGNPFFVTEVVRLLVAEGYGKRPCDDGAMSVQIPNGVREAVRRRLARLSAESYETLEVAALLGREFDLFLLEHVSGRRSLELLSQLEEGLRTRIVHRVQGTPSRLRFAHALVRETLYEDIGSRRRVELHRRVGEVLEETSGSAETALGDLAHHFEQSAIHGDVRKAVTYALRAARHARSQFAYAEAAGYLERAVRWLERDVAHDPIELCELILELGEAYFIAGNPQSARETFRRAGGMAERLGNGEQIARAAIGVSGPVVRFGMVDHSAISLLESALRLLPDDARRLRPRVLCRLAIELQYSAPIERRMALSREAMQLAREFGDVRTLADLMIERRTRMWKSESIEGRVADTDNLIRLADETGSIELGLDARCWRILDLLELGDLEAAKREMEFYATRAGPLRLPLYTHRAVGYQTIRAVLEGRLEDAESLALEFLSVARRVSDWSANAAFACQFFMIRRLRGVSFEDIIKPTERLVAEYPALGPARAGLALGYLELGRKAEARREYERLADNDFSLVSEDIFWAGTIGFLSELCAAFDDGPRAVRLYEMLLPYAERNVVLGLAGCWGAVARTLGSLATTMRDFPAAERHYESALKSNDRIGAVPFAALTRQDFSEMLLRRGDPGDRERAIALLEAALVDARCIGMARLLRETEAKLDAIRAGSPVAAPANGVGPAVSVSLAAALPTPRSVPFAERGPGSSVALLWRREGDYWSIGSAEAPFHLRDSVGVRCLAELLRRPNEELLAFNLASLATGDGQTAADGANGDVGGVGFLADPRAKAEYRSRLVELRETLDRATQLEDAETADRIRAEIDAVTAELTRAIGLRGRERPIASPVERARVNVTRTIRDAIRRVETQDSGLGWHLRVSVRTGTFCGYFPAVARAPRWQC